jgi:putative phosphoesterase
MSDVKIAVLSDIHGNSWALKAVLNDLKQRDITKIINLGDCVYGPLDPAGTLEMIADSNMITISGNEDEILFEQNQELNNTISFVRNKLNTEQITWLKELPDDLIINDEIFMFHGSPGNKKEHFLEKIGYGSLNSKSDKELKKGLENIKQSIILCGHSHLPELRRFSNGVIIMNPGSVGLQAYVDEDTTCHYVANGSPHARYSILKKRDDRWFVEKVEVAYDWEAASKIAIKNGRIDWSDWLRTGKVSIRIIGNAS